MLAYSSSVFQIGECDRQCQKHLSHLSSNNPLHMYSPATILSKPVHMDVERPFLKPNWRLKLIRCSPCIHHSINLLCAHLWKCHLEVVSSPPFWLPSVLAQHTVLTLCSMPASLRGWRINLGMPRHNVSIVNRNYTVGSLSAPLRIGWTIASRKATGTCPQRKQAVNMGARNCSNGMDALMIWSELSPTPADFPGFKCAMESWIISWVITMSRKSFKLVACDRRVHA